MDLLLSLLASFALGAGAGALVLWLGMKRYHRSTKPSFRRLKASLAPQPTKARNVTADAIQAERPTARQTTARFHPRRKNYTTRRKS